MQDSKFKEGYLNEADVYASRRCLLVEPSATACEPTRLVARMMNMISGGRSWSILLMESKLARSFSLSSFRSSGVMP